MLRGRPIRGLSILITGASSGIGQALALALAREGARLVVAARREDRLKAVAGACRDAGGEAIAWPTDVTRAADVERAVGAAVEQFGRVDVLVNNAGSGIYRSVERTAVEDLAAMLEVNLIGAFHGVKAVLPHMRREGKGQIVTVASLVAKRAMPRMGAYSAAKAAVVALDESLRVELRGSGIQVTTVYPGATATEFQQVASGGALAGSSRLGPRQPADACARAIVRAIRRPRSHVYPVFGTRMIGPLVEMMPWLADWLSGVAMRRFRPET